MTMFFARVRSAFMLSLLSLIFLGGCASTAKNPRDPLEPINRAVYQINDGLDKVVLKPVATVYKTVLPQFVRTGVTNFYNNLYDVLTAFTTCCRAKLATRFPTSAGLRSTRRSAWPALSTSQPKSGSKNTRKTSAKRSAAGVSAADRICRSPFSAPVRSATVLVYGLTSNLTRWDGFGAIILRRVIPYGDSISSTCAPTCSIRPKYSKKQRSILTSSNAMLTCSAAAIWFTTAIHRRKKMTRTCRS